MSEQHRNRPSVTSDSEPQSGLLVGLASPPRLTQCSSQAARVVMSIRLIALFAKTGRDPVGELTCRLGSVPAARAMLDLADYAGASWPENVQVFRPCCCALSPDEGVFAGMAEAALSGNRLAFADCLSGFIRPDRHDRLYALMTEAVALLP